MSDIMDDLEKFRVIYKLKEVYRSAPVRDRKESTAEHTFSSIVLADFLMLKYDFEVDRLRVFELLLYHDLVEIYAGDTPLHPNKSKVGQDTKERKAAERLFGALPALLSSKYRKAYEEFESRTTREAKLAKAIEVLDAEMHWLDYKQDPDWKGWTEEFLRKSKEHYFNEFPALKDLFEEHVRHLRENGYLGQ
jgi:putative hydrolase of HD superfamily